jgi:cytochrome-b5 reductase
LIVKVYPDGAMSSYLDALKMGDTVEMLGPHGAIGYPSAGTVTRGGKTQQQGVKHLVLIAAGSGITPMLQLVRAAVENAADSARVTVVYANRSLEHIISLNQLEPLASMFPGRVKIHHVLSQASGDADRRELGSFEVGRLTKDLLATHLPAPSPSIAVFHCGPPQFDEDVAKHLRALGFADDQVYVF